MDFVGKKISDFVGKKISKRWRRIFFGCPLNVVVVFDVVFIFNLDNVVVSRRSILNSIPKHNGKQEEKRKRGNRCSTYKYLKYNVVSVPTKHTPHTHTQEVQLTSLHIGLIDVDFT